MKVWESGEKLFTGLASPYQIRREGRARADVRRIEALTDAQTQIEIEKIKATALQQPIQTPQLESKNRLLLASSTDSSRNPRIEPYIGLPVFSDAKSLPTQKLPEFSEFRTRLENLEKLIRLRGVYIAAEDLASQGAHSDDPIDGHVDQEWLDIWRDSAERVTNDDAKMLWARLLNEETLRPGTISRRTLHTIRHLDHKEARLIAKIAPYIIENSLLKDEYTGNLLSASYENIEFSDLLMLEEAGIAEGSHSQISLTDSTQAGSDETHVILLKTASDYILELSFSKPSDISFSAVALTNAGAQIMKIGNFPSNLEFLKILTNTIRSRNSNSFLSAAIVKLTKMPDGTSKKIAHNIEYS